MKITVLEDNDPLDEYSYLLSVSTGYRRGASTSSQVNGLRVLVHTSFISILQHMEENKQVVQEFL